MHQAVINYLRNKGPSLPVEIGKAIGYDSLLTKAVLTELINKGLIKHSIRPIGGSLLYYLPGQEELMRKRLLIDLSIGERQVLNNLARIGEARLSELTPHDRAFIKRLSDFLIITRINNDYIIRHYNYKQIKPQQSIKPTISNQTIITNQKNDFNQKAINFIKSIGQIINKNKLRGKDYEYTIRLNKPLTQEVIIKVKDKKTITENDLSNAFTQAITNKKPVIIITNGQLSRRTEKWRKENTGSIVTIIRL